jgi:DNA repair protein RadC
LLKPLDLAGAEASARLLLKEFGSLAGVLAADAEAQRRLSLRADLVEFLQLIRSAMVHSLRAEVLSGPVISTSERLSAYLRADMAHQPTERFRVLFLDARNRLLRDETLSAGSVKEAPVYPREVMRRALEVGATALILVHNHPSGDAKPSPGDVEVTRRISEAGRELDITIHDHLVIARGGTTSFRALGLL